MELKKIYIIGNTTNGPWEDTVEKFLDAEKILLKLGYIVLNPIPYINLRLPKSSTKIRFKLLACADEVALLPDWKKCNNSRIEAVNARLMEMPEIFLV